MKRSPLKRKTRIKPVSDKKRAYRASETGQAALGYMRAVKQLPCAVCASPPPSDAHHCIHDRHSSAKRSDYDTIPLCKAHHQNGPDAIHNGPKTWREKYGPDHSYIDRVAEAVKRLFDIDRPLS